MVQVEKRIAQMFGMKAMTLKDYACNTVEKDQLAVSNILPLPSALPQRKSFPGGRQKTDADEDSFVAPSRLTDYFTAHPRALKRLLPLPGATYTHRHKQSPFPTFLCLPPSYSLILVSVTDYDRWAQPICP